MSDSEEELPVFTNLNCNRKRTRQTVTVQTGYSSSSDDNLEFVDLTNFEVKNKRRAIIESSVVLETRTTRTRARRNQLEHFVEVTIDLTDSPIRSNDKPANPVGQDSADTNRDQNPDPSPHHKPECPICLQPIRNMVSTFCGHVYCGDCIKESLKVYKKCPKCRKPLTLKKIHSVFL